MPSGTEGNPRIGYCETPMWADAETSMREAFPQVRERLVRAGFTVTDTVLPEIFAKAHEDHRILNDREGWLSLSHERLQHADQLSGILKAALENGASYSADDYDEARQTMKQARLALTKLWNDVDVLITPSVTGEAPAGIGFTGNGFAVLPVSVSTSFSICKAHSQAGYCCSSREQIRKSVSTPPTPVNR